MEEKINILEYCVGRYFLANVGYYMELKNAPKYDNIDPDDYFISDVLEVNFQKEVYNNKFFNVLCSKSKTIRKFCKSKSDCCFIGDTLWSGIFGEYCINIGKESRRITADDVNKLSEQLSNVYTEFLELVYKKDKKI